MKLRPVSDSDTYYGELPIRLLLSNVLNYDAIGLPEQPYAVWQYWPYEINSMQCTEGGVQTGGIYPYGPYLEIDNSMDVPRKRATYDKGSWAAGVDIPHTRVEASPHRKHMLHCLTTVVFFNY